MAAVDDGSHQSLCVLGVVQGQAGTDKEVVIEDGGRGIFVPAVVEVLEQQTDVCTPEDLIERVLETSDKRSKGLSLA